ncbi:hypothetical protein Bca4012_101187 [Brassica carinata]|uniref:F-box associated beta-propeller type 1 domain-containing protein n=1 Tax=Brassica carinata TaxID=52824 RepID=A0A8X7PMA3_BRACI|nr:hypothetical protein Bca52824_083634 [Brassica carinata]
MPKTRRMSDLPQELVGEKILTKVPITSVKEVRSTCKKWEAITKSWVVLGKAAAAAAVPHEFLWFMTMNAKVYSLRFHLREEEEEDLVVDVSAKQVDLLNQLEVSKVYHCDGLVLCVATDHSKLVVWNPYLCQTRLIGPRENFNIRDNYAIGYSSSSSERDHKILRFVDDYSAPGPTRVFRCEIYGISSDSWRVLKPKPEWKIQINEHHRGVSVKGNTYFFAHERFVVIDDFGGRDCEVEDFLLCFDFTKERFGPRLPLPFHSYNEDCVTLSNVRDDQLAVLFGAFESDSFEIWVTLTVEPDHVSWSKFLLVEPGPALKFKLNDYFGGSFFVDEENKVAVVFEISDPHQHTAFVFGQAGYIQSVNLGQVTKIQYLCPYTTKHLEALLPPLVCSSSYRPSLVQVKRTPLHKRKRHLLRG